MVVVWPRVVLICGLAMIFAPINVAAFRYTPAHLRGAAVGLFALLRNEGGSVGMSINKIIEHGASSSTWPAWARTSAC